MHIELPTEADPVRVIEGDCLDVLRSIPDGCVDAVVTSPPYNCGKRYETYTDAVPWEEYWGTTSAWLAECLRLLRGGGRLAVNLPWWMEKKPRRDVPHEFKNRAAAAGFLFLDKVTWIKGNSSNVHTSGGYGGNGCGWGTYLSPSGPSIRCASEPILIFSKGSRGRKVVSGEGRGACVRGDMTPEEWQEWTIDVWFVRGESSDVHPAVFPMEIPKRLMKLYTFPGELILDPFAGSGTTGIAAAHCSRRCILVEREQGFAQACRERVRKVLGKDGLFADV